MSSIKVDAGDRLGRIFGRLRDGRIRDRDKAALQALVAGVRAGVDPGVRASAIALLPRVFEPTAAAALLENVVQDGQRDQSDRIQAVRSLGRIGTDEEARRALWQSLPAAEPALRLAIYEELAATITDADRAQVMEIDEPDAAAARLLGFTRTLSSFLAGDAADALPRAEPSPIRPDAEDAGRDVSIKALDAASAARAIRDAGQGRYGVQPAADVLLLQCGQTQWDLVAQAAAGGFSGDFDLISARPWVFATVALHRGTALGADIQYVVLTDPQLPEVRLQVVRTDGVVAYVGKIEAAEDGYQFRVVDSSAGCVPPTELAGTVSGGQIRLTEARVAAKLAAVGLPAPSIVAQG